MGAQRDPLTKWWGCVSNPELLDSKLYACSLLILDKGGTAAYTSCHLAMITSLISSFIVVPLHAAVVLVSVTVPEMSQAVLAVLG